jgi:nucleotide-binding universal stress UspA family protein
MPQVLEAAEEQAKFEAQQLHQMFAGMPHEVTVAEGDLWPVLSEIVDKQKTDLIVMGTHGRTGVSRALLGSAAEEVFRRAACAVLTVGPFVSRNTVRRLAMKEILFATDFSDGSLAALPYAISMAQEHQSNLTLLHVIGKAKAGELVHSEQYADSTLRRLQALVPPGVDLW